MQTKITLAALVALAVLTPAYNFAQTQPTAEESLADFDVHPDLKLTLFASEPMLVNPTNIDIDQLGRVWVAEAVNYRNQIRNGDSPEREAGDRIVVLEDTDQDGRADQSKTFYQDPSINSPHGICVLGNTVIVSAGDSVIKLIDTNNDLVADEKQVLFTGIRGVQHDHGIHAFVFGPDGKLYFNFGNEGKRLLDANGQPVIDLAGNEVQMKRPYQNGMIFRCNLDGSQVETLAWNFRNNWEVCVDAFGRIWQSDNDDDGNRGTRINYVLPYGNYGFCDEVTGAGWRTERTGQAAEIPQRHWHLNDPGVVPNMLQAGAGSPTGIAVYEGDLLPKTLQGQLVHCDAGPNVVRAYPATRDGAGFKAEMVNLMDGSQKNQWFRPSDVCVAPDGSLFVSDWFDAGVGGHRMVDIGGGRIYRLTPRASDSGYEFHRFSFDSVDDSVAGLASANQAIRFTAWQSLAHKGELSLEPLLAIATGDGRPRNRARAIWFLGKERIGEERVRGTLLRLLSDSDENIRATLVRLASQSQHDEFTEPFWQQVDFSDPSQSVRRELLIAMRQPGGLAFDVDLWCELADGYQPGDRWYLEALGIAAHNHWDECLAKLMEKDSWDLESESVQDLVWRSRANITPQLLAKVIALPSTSAEQTIRYFRSLDFCQPAMVDPVVRELAFSAREESRSKTRRVIVESTSRFQRSELSPDEKEALTRVVQSLQGTSDYLNMVKKFSLKSEYDRLLQIALDQVGTQKGVDAMTALLQLGQSRLLKSTLMKLVSLKVVTEESNAQLSSMLMSLASTGKKTAAVMIGELVQDKRLNLESRRQAVAALGTLFPGSLQLIEWAENDEFDRDLEPAFMAALSNSPSDSIRERARKRFPELVGSSGRPIPSLNSLLKLEGNAERGAEVFASKAAQCANCHVVGEEGKSVGPDLSEIGSKLSRSAMYESILYPSAGISHGYENWSVLTVDGELLSGLKLEETESRLVIQNKDGIKRTVDAEDVEQKKTQKLSLMPDGLHDGISDQQLADLVRYMEDLRKSGDSAPRDSITGREREMSQLAMVASSEFDGVRYIGEVLKGDASQRHQEVEANIAKASSLYLVVSDAGDGYSFDWADWCDTVLIDADGVTTKLSELTWDSAKSGWGQPAKGVNCGGEELSIAGVEFKEGVGAHANSVIHFELPSDHQWVKFQAIAGIDDGGANQGGGSRASVRFAVLVEAPPADYFKRIETVLSAGE